MPEGVTPNMYSSRFQHLFANGVPPPSDGSSLTRSSSNEDEMFGQQPIDGGFELPGAAPGAPASIATPAISFGGDRNMPAGGSAAMQPPLQLGAGPIRFGGQLPTAPASSDTDIIPTAIVIKNIPFNIKREQLLHVIRDLGIPVPYAFNYHFDQGIFRGLAFANFHSPAEANEVVAALNGLDVSGRKLRVEYKKVLQAGEKERIEKEKAIKRMQMPHSGDKERRKDKSLTPEFAGLPPLGGLSPSPARVASPGAALLNGFSPPSAASAPPSMAHKDGKSVHDPSPFVRPTDAQHDTPLDLNDAGTLEIYSRVLLFKDDRMRDELAFSRCLTPAERRTVHLVAQKLGLYHYTVGTADDCHVLVTKFERPQHASPKAEHDAPFGERPQRLDLRGKKSVPDMKRAMQSERDVLHELERAASPAKRNLLAPTAAIGAHKSNTNLRESFGYTQDRRFDAFNNFGANSAAPNIFASPFDIPVVPHVARPNSVDIERLEQYHKHAHPASFRSRSPLAHSGLPPSASSPVPPMAHSTGALEAPMPGLPHRPHPTRNMPVDLMLDGHAAKSRSRMAPPSHASAPEKGRSKHEGRTAPPHSEHDTTSPRPVPPTITTSSSNDE